MVRRGFLAGVWDCHAHLLGSGDSGSGCWIGPKLESTLPGVIPLFSVEELVKRGCLAKNVGDHVKRIREYNPLMFDFVLKRHIQVNGRRLDKQIFETARVFRRPGSAIPI